MKILVIRRDNIGDLVCTTPLLAALRQHYPNAWIGILANAYNAEVLHANPHVDAVFVYRKAKHRAAGESKLGIWLETAALMLRLRRQGIDLAVVASPGGERYARMVGARRILADKPSQPAHEVERCCAMLVPLNLQPGVRLQPGPLGVWPRPELLSRLQARLAQEHAARFSSAAPADYAPPLNATTLAVHISSRKPTQRWPAESFVQLIRQMLAEQPFARVLLFWSPGAADDPLHPGDDDKAAAIIAACHDLPVFPLATHTLAELVAGLALADLVFCSDGGAMHIAAGLGKPVVCMFGDSPPAQWHPWGVPHIVLQAPDRLVSAISVAAASAAIADLRARTVAAATEEKA